ncbi:MAG: phosphate signaling complex protein PhoU [Anaerolineae bacterium]|nr:phosphate signaling complex protein PhoU [Anaerolineae bacterium]MCX8066641.1 phosphate signaling complex protein PhoU [Anaerolineae bacterium]MDW7992537.1 phosphate signaling complex protein PhoU [Anaerolineae bacterium]
MARKILDQQLQEVKEKLLILGAMVEQALLESAESLRKRDMKTARRVIATDREVNDRRFAIEALTIGLIATQQPVAGDLRRLAAILEIAGELERIGDYAKGIAVINLRMEDRPNPPVPGDLIPMAQKAADMLHRALLAFVNEDAEAARAIPREDDEVDALYLRIYRDLMNVVVCDPSAVERINWLLWAAHNLERAADRVTNICERTIYAVTGEMAEMDVTWDELEG